MSTKGYDQDHYEVLDLPSSTKDLSEKDIKLAYRRALLLHHPDKSHQTPSSRSDNPSIDQITTAYQTLIDPITRSQYQKSQVSQLFRINPLARSHPGLETVDLDDLLYDEQKDMWYGSCRCGKQRAYLVSKEELEMHVEDGEVFAGCEGCSLWLRITFAVDDDEDG